MVSIAFALGSAMAWGAADFLGGLKTRTVPLAAVSAYSQFVALVLLLGLVAMEGVPPVDVSVLLWGIPTGVAYVVGLGAFYRGLATGRMSLVAPIVGLHGALPVSVGLLGGERLSAGQAAGVAVALLGIFLVARESDASGDRRATTRVALTLGAVAAVGLGINLIGIDAATEGQPASSLLWLLVATRVVAIVLWIAIGLRPGAKGELRRPPLGPLIALGALEVAANLLYGLAVRESLLTLAAVLVSLHPVFTALLSRIVLGERLRRAQQGGFVLAVVGVALLST